MNQRTTSYILAALLSTLANTQVNADPLGYVSDSSGAIVRDSSGNCVHSGSWTAAIAIPACDGVIVKKAAPVVTTPAPVIAKVAVPAQVAVAPKAVETQAITKPIVLDIANFATSSAKLFKIADEKLNKVVEAAKQDQSAKFIVSGHTDNRGKKAFNQKLSVKRAESVKSYLVKHGVAANRISTIGYGYTKPVASNKTKAGRSANRRVEVNYSIK